jgi:hypothetical protein
VIILFHDFNIFWLLVFQIMLRFHLHWWDINCRNGHMQNLNFLQFRYFVIYFVIFVSMDWETESVIAGTFVWIFIFLFQVKIGLYHADFIYTCMCTHNNNVVLIFLLFVKWNTIKHSYQQASTKDQKALISVIFLEYSYTTCYNHWLILLKVHKVQKVHMKQLYSESESESGRSSGAGTAGEYKWPTDLWK